MIKSEELNRVRELIQKDNKVRDMWLSLEQRVREKTQKPGLIQPTDTQAWWHLVWERLSDVAFVQVINPTEGNGEWLRNTVMQIVEKPIDEWVGPWFRKREETVQGYLETSHVGLAVATVLDLCPEIFTEEELVEVKNSLREKSQILCLNWIKGSISGRNFMNNWFMVLINGFGTVSAVLNDQKAVEKTVEFYQQASRLYKEDSYDETFQYWNYASIHMAHLYEVLVRYNSALADEIDYSSYTKCIPWIVNSFMYMKPLSGWGEKDYPRSLNFGDSAAIFRPTADVLLHIASRAQDTHPVEAGLARWLFDKTYADTDLQPTDRASFGFFNQHQFFAILQYADAVKPLSPEEVDLPLTNSFTDGTIVARSEWEKPKTVLGVHGGYEQAIIASHRHGDQNSFILSHLKERFFVDPGHCSYRLPTQLFSKSSRCHNTWLFETADGKVLEQKLDQSDLAHPHPPLNKKILTKELDGISVIRSDAGDTYPEPIIKAERLWIAAMPNSLFIVDRIEAAEPVKVKSNFIINNRDGMLRYNIATDTKLVFRRHEAAMKFFLVDSKTDSGSYDCDFSFDYGYVHDCYHPLPSQKGQGAEGSGMIFDFTSQGASKTHTKVFVVAMDEEVNIKQWHIRTLNDSKEFYVEPPAKTGGYSIVMLDDGNIQVNDLTRHKEYLITYDDFKVK